jgi:hypothetical protein
MKRKIPYSDAQKHEIGRRAGEALTAGKTIGEFMADEAAADRPIDASLVSVFRWMIAAGGADREEHAIFLLSLRYFFLGFLQFFANGPVRKRRNAARKIFEYIRSKVARRDSSTDKPYNYLQTWRRKNAIQKTLMSMPRSVYAAVCLSLSEMHRIKPQHAQYLYSIDATNTGIKATDGIHVGSSLWVIVVLDVRTRHIAGWHASWGCPDSADTVIAMWKAFRRKTTPPTMVAFGLPWIVQRDHHRQFDGFLAEYLWHHRVFWRYTIAGKPTSNAEIERAIRTLKEMTADESDLLFGQIDLELPGTWQNGDLLLPPRHVIAPLTNGISAYNRHEHRTLGMTLVDAHHVGMEHALIRPYSDVDFKKLELDVTLTGEECIRNYAKLPGIREAIGELTDENITMRLRATDWQADIELLYKNSVLQSFRRDFFRPFYGSDEESAGRFHVVHEPNLVPEPRPEFSLLSSPCNIILR